MLRRKWTKVLGYSVLLLICVSCPAVASAAALEFAAPLSLTGGCSTSTLDPVPDPECPSGSHPPNSFAIPRSVAVNSCGDIYVASYGNQVDGSEGRIDIFDPEGRFLSELTNVEGPEALAVDDAGTLYVYEMVKGEFPRVRRFRPSLYNTAGCEVAYGEPAVVAVENKELPARAGIAVDSANGHLFVDYAQYIAEYGSYIEENKLLDNTIGEGTLHSSVSVAIDAAHGRIYASDSEPPTLQVSRICAFELEAPHKMVATIDGSTTPERGFFSVAGLMPVAVNEESGNVFVWDSEASPKQKIYEFDASGAYLSTIEHGLQYNFTSEIEVDNGSSSPNRGTLFVPSGHSGVGHSFAFTPPPKVGLPIIESTAFSAVTSSEAKLQATINPNGAETKYVFEYVTEEAFKTSGFEGASRAGEGQIPVGSEGVDVSASISGLDPGISYRFKVVAENEFGNDSGEGNFSTYPEEALSGDCPNEPLRTLASAALPDCRAYELVSPPETNARTPVGIGFLGDRFATQHASPSGAKVSFLTEGGSIPGHGGTGSYSGDPYLSTRTSNGWATVTAGPNGLESVAPEFGGLSTDQGYQFWSTGLGQDEGSAVIGGERTKYVRYPDGHSALIGRGSLATDPRADGKFISEEGRHIIFVSANFGGKQAVQLEKNAPPDGTQTIYDRTSDEITNVVSLLPGSITPSAGDNALYVGASRDGEGVAFQIGSTLYLRYHNEETYEIGKSVTFAGIAEGGARIFYVEGGDLEAFDVEAKETINFSEGGSATPVNVSIDGAAAYFVSRIVLTKRENPNKATAQKGAENLYLSREGTISFVGTVTERDVKGEFNGNEQVDGLGLWMAAVGDGQFGEDPSRITPDGSVLLFESRADLTGYDPKGHAEIYRYDPGANTLDCLSCNPTLAPAVGEASLESVAQGKLAAEPFSSYALVNNLRADGHRAFFQSTEVLVPNDTDGRQDVYEWEAGGVGSCDRPSGCVYLISSGQSERDDYLYAVSDSGDDVFIRTADLLLPIDAEKTASVYDARVNGGFAEPEPEICQGEGCKGPLGIPPALPTPGMLTSPETGNLPKKHCSGRMAKTGQQKKKRCAKHRHRHRKSRKKGAK